MGANMIPWKSLVKTEGVGDALYWSFTFTYLRKIEKHISAKNTDKVKIYLLEMFSRFSPTRFIKEDSEYFGLAEYEDLKTAYDKAVRFLVKYGYIIGFSAMYVPELELSTWELTIYSTQSGNFYYTVFDPRK